MSNIFQIKRGGTEPPYIETDDTTPNSSKSYYTKNGNTYTLFEGSEFAQGTAYYENVLKKYELGFNTSTDTLYINNNGTIEVPFARVKVDNIDGTLPVSKGGTGQTAITASRLLYSKSTTQLASTSITSDGSYLGDISYLTINAAHQTDWHFYVNGSAMLSSNSVWYVQDSRYNASTNPSSDVWGAGFYMKDSNGTNRAYVREVALTGGGQGVQLQTVRTVNGQAVYNGLLFTTNSSGVRSNSMDGPLTISGNLSVTGTIAGTLDGNATNVTGTVSVANGGTGATNRKAAVDSLIYLGTNQTDLLSSTSSSTTGAYGHCIAWFNQSSTDSKKPTDYGMLLQIANGGEISQLWFEHLNGAIYHRGMNGGHAPSTIGWKKIYDTNMSYTRSSIGTIDWGTNDDYLITKAALAYWNGAYSGTTSNLSILGTVTKGTWNGSAIAIGYGGTGATTKVNAQKNLGIQAGTTTANSSSVTSVTFPSAFSNVPKVVASWATTSTNESGGWGALKISEITKTGFKIAAAGSNPSTAKNVEWIAVDNA